MNEKSVWVYDIETLFNFFCITFSNVTTGEKAHFRIWKLRNDLLLLYEFMERRVEGLVGFNNIGFDWPVLNYLLVAHRKWSRVDGEVIALAMHEKAMQIISQEFSALRNPSIPQLDVYLIYHFNNKHKAVSLKALQIAMGWPLVADMPIDHTEIITTEEQANLIAEYNLNDVMSTEFFFKHKKTREAIDMRHGLGEIYGIDFLNDNESKIGEKIVVDALSKAMKIPVEEVRKMRTLRPYLPLDDCILPSIHYNSPAFNTVLKRFRDVILINGASEDTDKEDWAYLYDDMEYYFGLGGLHAARPSGVYSEDAKHMIISADVSSYYINLAISNNFGPEHFMPFFIEVVKEIYEGRMRTKKGTPENYGRKQALVSIFGKSNSEYSPLYDLKYFFQTTLNGQLLIALLCERITEAGGKILMANTDGVEIYCLRSDEEKIRKACSSWAEEVKLALEYKQYKRLFIRDVNNYIGEFLDGTTYNKGAFEFQELKWDKDHSMLCVPFAAQELLTKGKPVLQSFAECDINQFLIGKRAKSGGRFELRKVDNTGDSSRIQTTFYHRTVRYLVAKRGGYLFKLEEGTKSAKRIDAPWKIMDCMQAPLQEEKGIIDTRYYEQEVKKLVRPILQTQVSFL